MMIEKVIFEKPKIVENYEEQMETERNKIIEILRETHPLLKYMPDSQFYKIDDIGYYVDPDKLDYSESSFTPEYARNLMQLSNLEAITECREDLENGKGFTFEDHIEPMGWTWKADYASENLPPLTAEQTETLYEIQGKNDHLQIIDIMTSLYPELVK